MHRPEPETRALVVAEALTWRSTPYHHAARLKHIGVDCLMFLVEVYTAAGVVRDIDIPFYQKQFNLHRGDETYLDGLLRYTREVESPKPGDVVLFKMGRVFAHAGIVLDWPRLIHASQEQGVVIDDADRNARLSTERKQPRPRKFFSYW